MFKLNVSSVRGKPSFAPLGHHGMCGVDEESVLWVNSFRSLFWSIFFSIAKIFHRGSPIRREIFLEPPLKTTVAGINIQIPKSYLINGTIALPTLSLID